ncbi:MAG: hypothetical protein V4574_11995 [Pseudomonadota bacterium]
MAVEYIWVLGFFGLSVLASLMGIRTQLHKSHEALERIAFELEYQNQDRRQREADSKWARRGLD